MSAYGILEKEACVKITRRLLFCLVILRHAKFTHSLMRREEE